MNLRQRALFAHNDRVSADSALLITRAERALQEQLGLEDSDTVLILDADPYSKPPTAKLRVGDIDFKVTVFVEEKTAQTGQSNTGMEWEELLVGVFVKRGETFVPVESLADVGKVLKDEPLPELEGEALGA